MYSSIVKKPAAPLAAAAEVYLHVPSVVLRGSCTVSRLSTWVWNPPRALPLRRVTTQVSAPKSSTSWITVLKKKSDTPAEDGQHPTRNLLRPGQVLHHRWTGIVRCLDHHPSYLKEVTISRGSPYALKTLEVTSVCLTSISYPVNDDLEEHINWLQRVQCFLKVFPFSSMSATVIGIDLVMRWFMMYFFNDNMYPLKTSCRAKMYVLYTDSSTIVLSSTSMLLWFYFMQQASACLHFIFK